MLISKFGDALTILTSDAVMRFPDKATDFEVLHICLWPAVQTVTASRLKRRVLFGEHRLSMHRKGAEAP
jgi:hypothetical protein